MAYSHYLQPGRRWNNKFGEPLSFATLLEALLDRQEKTCGGAHQLGAFARTLSREELNEDPHIARLWPSILQRIQAALINLKSTQRGDGSFERPYPAFGSPSLLQETIYNTGHAIEWITLLGKTDYLKDDWVVAAISRLADAIAFSYERTYARIDLRSDERAYFDFDGLCHAVSGLVRWRELLRG